MTGSFRLLILIPADPVPPWVSGLSQRLQQSGITNEIAGPGNHDFTGFDAVLNLTSVEMTADIPVITHNLPDLLERNYPYKLTQVFNSDEEVYDLHIYLLAEGKEYLMNTGEYRTALYSYPKLLREATINLIILLETSVRQFASGLRSHHRPVVIKNTDRKLKLAPRSRFLSWKRLSGLFFRDHWFCAIINSPIYKVALEKTNFDTDAVHNDKTFLRADPFGIIHQGKPVILYERINPGKKGIIAGKFQNEESILLSNSTHYSYPFLFNDNGNIFCIPEQHELNRVDLYRLNVEKKSLEFDSALLHDISLADVSIVFHEQKYWMFCTDNSGNGANLRLLIFYSQSLKGEWKPHSLNPVKTSIKGARSAGTPFIHNGRLYRPAQNCSKSYGGSVSVYRVVNLSETSFEEELIHEVLPSQFGSGYSGIHTISSLGDQTLIDLKKKVFTLRNLLHLFRKK